MRIDSDIVSRARYLSAQLGVPISEMFSNILRPEIDQMFRKITKEVLESEGPVAEAVEPPNKTRKRSK